jgi:hypothetical protein
MKKIIIILAMLFVLFLGCIISNPNGPDVNQYVESKELTETIKCIFENTSLDSNAPKPTCEYYFMSPSPSLSPQKGCDLLNYPNSKECIFEITRSKGTSVIIQSSNCTEKFGFIIGDLNSWNYETNLPEYNPQREFIFSC